MTWHPPRHQSLRASQETTHPPFASPEIVVSGPPAGCSYSHQADHPVRKPGDVMKVAAVGLGYSGADAVARSKGIDVNMPQSGGHRSAFMRYSSGLRKRPEHWRSTRELVTISVRLCGRSRVLLP